MKTFQESGQEFLQRIQAAATIDGEFYEQSTIEVLDNLASLFEKSPNVFVAFSNEEIIDFVGDYATRNDLLDEKGSFNINSFIAFIGEKSGKDFSFLSPIIEKFSKGQGLSITDMSVLTRLFSL